jgi:DNA-binding response OmpR family regulator
MRDATKILLVEDDDTARNAMQRYLEHAGYEVTAVRGPDEAIETGAALGIKVLICDWELGTDKDGVDVARELQRQTGAAVIFITGQSLAELRIAARDVDVKAYFQKPVSLSAIAACLQ